MNVNQSFYIFLVVFLLAISLEGVYGYYSERKLYNIKDSLVNVFLGASGILNRAITQGIWLSLWVYIYQFSFIKIPETIWAWILLFFGNEFVYYWFHRLSHEKRVLWAIHVNHHSSEYLNFTTAARIPFFNLILHNVFWIPLLLVGFNPFMIFAVENIGFLFAFVQHTQVIKRIPYLEFIFNTPSHHRVHHSSNEEYLNKNFGNVLIIFDRIFGTFKEEQEDVDIKYGISKNINSYNPATVIFHEWIDIFKEIRKKKA